MTEKNGPTESSKAEQVETVQLSESIKGVQTVQMQPTQNVVQSPFADHIPGLRPQPSQVQPDSRAQPVQAQPDSQVPVSSVQATAARSGDAPSSDSSD